MSSIQPCLWSTKTVQGTLQGTQEIRYGPCSLGAYSLVRELCQKVSQELWKECVWNHGHREQTSGCQEGGCWGGMEWEVGVSRCKLLYIEWINSKVLLYSTGNYIQYPMINHNGKEHRKECLSLSIYMCVYVYVCITESLCCTAVINTTL